MADETDGLTIALERIAQEAGARTGFLDLGRLGLTSLPEELFRLKHLRRFNLGVGLADENGEQQENTAYFRLSPNRVYLPPIV
jgi:hypothetical protein